jgi:Methyltransferase domain
VRECRNCRSANLKELGFVGEVAPFFLKRVLNMEVRPAMASHPLRLFARRVCALPQRFLEKVYGSRAYVEMQVCLDCSFVQTKHPFPDADLGRLYADYRSAGYNEERIRYEPTYAALAQHVGSCDREVEERVGGLSAWLRGKLSADGDFTMLDYGGSDGRFLPRIEGKRFVFEISNITPVAGVVRIAEEASLGTYSYVQIAHVLEHVPEPLALLKRVAAYVQPSGYLYVEVPQDLPDSRIAELKAGRAQPGVVVHEHINVYCASSVTALVKAAGLEPVSIKPTKVNLGWISGTNIRALCRKAAIAALGNMRSNRQ